MQNENQHPVTAPTYNELFALVAKLRDEVAMLSKSPGASVAAKSEVTEFRVVPDLNKTIRQFTGRESSHQAEKVAR